MRSVAYSADSKATTQRWYVIQSQPNREFVAEKHLSAQGFQTFLPVHWKTTRHARRFRTSKAPLFVRYLFVKLDLTRDRWRSVNGTFGVARMIMEGEMPKPVPPGVVEALLAISEPNGTLSFCTNLQAGQPVRVTSGPFAGVVGRMVKATSAERVQVLLEIMGSHVALSARKVALAPAA